jgi:hypothetical protein
MTWFVDKLGPAPNRASARPSNGAVKQAQPARQQQAQGKSAPQQKAASTPEPKKEKKKGWF